MLGRLLPLVPFLVLGIAALIASYHVVVYR